MADKSALLEACNYGREKLKGLFPRNLNLLNELASNIVPSQYMIDFGNAQNFMMMGYRRHPKAKKINNNYFKLLVVPNGSIGALYGYGSSISPYVEMTTVIGDKVAWPKVKSLEDGSDLQISSVDELEKAQAGIIQQLAEVVQDAESAESVEKIKKAVDTCFDNLNVIYKFLTDVETAFKDSPAKTNTATLQQGVDEVNQLLAEAEQKLNDLRVLANKMSAGTEAEEAPDSPGYDMPDFDTEQEERYQRRQEAERNFDPIVKLFGPGFGFDARDIDFYQ